MPPPATVLLAPYVVQLRSHPVIPRHGALLSTRVFPLFARHIIKALSVAMPFTRVQSLRERLKWLPFLCGVAQNSVRCFLRTGHPGVATDGEA